MWLALAIIWASTIGALAYGYLSRFQKKDELMSGMAANSVKAHMPLGWVVHPPLCKHPMIPDFYDVGVDIALAASCINITLQQGTDDLEKWYNKWL